ncbi:MAG: hypothetical protein FD189_1061 [Elusimicrobia bacterium]|nr:MAG: hypothetical protein FD189_1061 [Elusimicrobiota bacterium]
MPLGDLKIVPNPYVPEDTIIVGPATYERLTGESYADARVRFAQELKNRQKALVKAKGV